MKAIFIQGFAGAGKSTLVKFLAEAENATVLDRDLMVEGKDDRSAAYRILKEKLQGLLLHNENVIIDAPFLFELKDGSFKNWLTLFSNTDQVATLWLDGSPKALFQRRRGRGLSRDLDPGLLEKIQSEKKRYGRIPGLVRFYTDRISRDNLNEAALFIVGSNGRETGLYQVPTKLQDNASITSLYPFLGQARSLPSLVGGDVGQVPLIPGLSVFAAFKNRDLVGVLIFSPTGELICGKGEAAPASALLPVALASLERLGCFFFFANQPTLAGGNLLNDFAFIGTDSFYYRHF